MAVSHPVSVVRYYFSHDAKLSIWVLVSSLIRPVYWLSLFCSVLWRCEELEGKLAFLGPFSCDVGPEQALMSFGLWPSMLGIYWQQGQHS